MQFSEQWLRQFVNPAMNSDVLGHALTMAGLEVEEQKSVAAVFAGVVIGQILSAEKHPDADRLQICRVDVGSGEPLQIVCGASNARAGLKAPCALVGAALPGFNIKQAKVRGVESFGMMCSSKELGLAEESTGLLELPADAPVGMDIRQFLALDDQLFTLKLTPNRSDCLSIVGIARDVAAITGAVLNLPALNPVAVTSANQKSVAIEQTSDCLRYAGRLIEGVNANALTPDWMARRLERSGIRSISAIVDITNYVLLELGQPLHAFDAAKLQGDICVRSAKPAESIVLLNQQEVKVDTDMLVIADDSGAIALAGIMGGASTSVNDSTQSIFLESAFFTPDAIAGKARRLGLSTDSSYRFERGVDYGNTLQALEYATQLIQQLCGGQAGPVIEVVGALPERKAVTLRHSKLQSILGIAISESQVAQYFAQLGFSSENKAGSFVVTPPSYRFDISIEEDLVEEIARLHGYDHIPAIAPQAALTMLPASESQLKPVWLRDIAVAHGYQEIVNYSFVEEQTEREILGNSQPIKLKNPIASNMSVMRSSLWVGLLDTLVYNLNRKQARVRLFEIGSAYTLDGEAYQEKMLISGLAYGAASPEQWAEPTRELDFFDIKAVTDALGSLQVEYKAAQHPALHPGQSAQIMLNNKAIGWFGKLHPKWQQHYQLPLATFVFELDATALLSRQLQTFTEVAKFPPIRRDLAVIVDENIEVKTLIDTMLSAQISVVNDVRLFDVYRGKGIAENKKSLAFLVLMQDTQKTLTDVEADEAMSKLLDSIKKNHGAELR
ncbi:MAG: phenylalanine--tRNA ligase subunit beta [Methylophilaceae bacterium]|nr:phenylalanine--tRNA ligase subunit beta [Methyloradius sp.]